MTVAGERLRYAFLLLLWGFVLLPPPPALADPPPPVPPAAPEAAPPVRRLVEGPFEKPYLIPLDRMIDETLAASIGRRMEEAKAAGADLIFIEIDSPGGLVHSSIEIGDLLFTSEIPVVMLIFEEAISGAALVALAGHEIVMGERALIGDCQPISFGPEGIEVAPEKIQSPLRAVFRKYAERNGYPIALAESMVTQEYEVRRVRFPDGTVLYLTPEDMPAAMAIHGETTDYDVVVSKTELLTMTAAEARGFGFTGPLAKTRAEAFGRFGVEESQVVVLSETWAEELSRFLLSIKHLLFFAGLIAAWIEFKAPGFGVPGALAIVCFALFFSASWISGIGSGLEVVLFLLGMALIALEIFVIPGFGVPGILGFVLVVASLYLASVNFGLPSIDRPWEMEALLDWALAFGLTLAASFGAMILVARWLPGTAIGRRLILEPAGGVGSLGLTGSASVDSRTAAPLLGRSGRATSALRPAGRIEVDGEPYSAVTEGDWIEAGEEIVVREVRGNRIVVQRR